MVLTFIGCDDWDRPVYSCCGQLYVDVAPRRDRAPEICTKQGNAFNGEPLASIAAGAKVEFVPHRMTWD